MPKISAASVAEHRRLTTEAILDAAESLLMDADARLTLAAVGRRVGLQRSSLYRYFASLDDLVEAVAVRGFPRWTQEVSRLVEAAATPHEAVAAYVDANLAEAVESRHAWRAGLARLHLGEDARRRIGAMHDDLVRILVGAVATLPRVPGGRRDLCVSAVQALTDRGVTQIHGVSKADHAAHRAWYVAAALRIVEVPPDT